MNTDFSFWRTLNLTLNFLLLFFGVRIFLIGRILASALVTLISRALVKPVTVNIRDGQNVTAVTEASRGHHVKRFLKRVWPSSVTDYYKAVTDFL